MQINSASTTAEVAPLYDTAKLYRDYSAKVSRWAARLTRSSTDADDIVQEVFLTVHRRLPSLDRVHSPGPWLLKMTLNVARHLWRARGRSTKRERSWEAQCLPSVPASPLEELEMRRAAEQLETALASLDDRYREIYWLCEVKRLPSAKVAALTGLNPDTLRVRRFRARAQIAKRLAAADKALEAA
jgi:RNA polymerase sigma-70 factor (ECF subfamily)